MLGSLCPKEWDWRSQAFQTASDIAELHLSKLEVALGCIIWKLFSLSDRIWWSFHFIVICVLQAYSPSLQEHSSCPAFHISSLHQNPSCLHLPTDPPFVPRFPFTYNKKDIVFWTVWCCLNKCKNGAHHIHSHSGIFISVTHYFSVLAPSYNHLPWSVSDLSIFETS